MKRTPPRRTTSPRDPSDATLNAALRRDAAERLATLDPDAAALHASRGPIPRGPVLLRIGGALAAAAAVALLVTLAWNPWASTPPAPAGPTGPGLVEWTEQAGERWSAWEAAWHDRVTRAERSVAAALDAGAPDRVVTTVGDSLAEPYERELDALAADLGLLWRRSVGGVARWSPAAM